jgi:hypothetical protein
MHMAPAPHAAPPPQVHVPAVASHPSLLPAGQGAHAAPRIPHESRAGALHIFPMQQPVGHESALHTQAPAKHIVPAPQIGPAPQRHSPLSVQLSARAGSQVTHAAPPEPHEAVDGAVQVEPEQQPFGQLLALQSVAQVPPVHIPTPQF